MDWRDETIEVRAGDPDVERAAGMWLLNCDQCQSTAGLAWKVGDEVVSLCMDCGEREQAERAARGDGG